MKNSKITAASYIKTLLAHDRYYFTAQSFADQFGLSKPQAHQTLLRLKRAGYVCAVEKGKYLTLGLQPERVLANPLFIATKIAAPGYVSFWSALHYYGLTEQAPRAVFVATTRKKAPVTFDGYHFQYVQFKPQKFFGYHREMIDDLPVLMAEREKALVDALAEPRYAGGIDEIAKCLFNARADLNVETLIAYANQMDSASLGSRLGFLLSQMGIQAKGLVLSKSFVRLNPTRKPSRVWDTRWRVNVNVPRRALTEWQAS